MNSTKLFLEQTLDSHQ
uniref:Uncharacterized protein n=1 Tax=Anguilla anguilla TaxID=7936 RepID=A0A0E9RKY7_ANGAN